MSRSRCLVVLSAVAMLVVALPAAALPSRALAPATPAAAKSLLTVFTDYADRGETLIFDAATRRLLSRTTRQPRHRSAGANAQGATVTGPSPAQRCSNAGSYEEFDAGYPRPWRLSEPFHINASGAPSSRVGDWRNQIIEGKRVWEQTRNACGIGDIVIWDMPALEDTGAVASPSCGESDDLNVVGFANMGGWASDGLVLARTCVWSTLDFIYESDMVFNIHGDAKWANGAFAGYWDLQSVASHEFGHALGLGHTENGASRETAAAVMHPIVYQQDTRNRSLSRGDIDGATSLYPRLFGFEIVAATIQNLAGSGARLEPNRTYVATVDVINRGYRSWRVGDSAGLLVSTHPLGRCSSYAGGDWRSCSEPSVLDADLTDGGGGPENTAAIVAQGEQGRFEFQVPVTWAREGTLSFEQFRVRGIPVSDPGTFSLSVDVGTIAAVVVGQSGPGILLQNVVLRGMPAVASVTIRNEGTAPWILDGRLSLVTDPAGRCSVYRGSDWPSCTAASGVDRPQGIVQAGETATFSFNFGSPLYLGPGARAANERFDVEYAGRPTPRLNAKTQFRYEMW